MKRLLLTSLGLVGLLTVGQGQHLDPLSYTVQVVLDNEQMKVTEYVSTPGRDVCGLDQHSHPAHLSILVTDAAVELTGEDGKTQRVDLSAGTAFWSEEETHSVVNTSTDPIRVLLVEVKE